MAGDTGRYFVTRGPGMHDYSINLCVGDDGSGKRVVEKVDGRPLAERIARLLNGECGQ